MNESRGRASNRFCTRRSAKDIVDVGGRERALEPASERVKIGAGDAVAVLGGGRETAGVQRGEQCARHSRAALLEALLEAFVAAFLPVLLCELALGFESLHHEVLQGNARCAGEGDPKKVEVLGCPGTGRCAP